MTEVPGNEHNLIVDVCTPTLPKPNTIVKLFEKKTSIFRQMAETLNYLGKWKMTSLFCFSN